MNHSRLLKTTAVIGVGATICAAIIAPQVEGYSDFVSLIAFVSLSLFLLVYCLYAFKAGEIEVRGFVSKKEESPKLYWFGMLIYLVFSVAILSISFHQQYT